jgi:hypothetical protein
MCAKLLVDAVVAALVEQVEIVIAEQTDIAARLESNWVHGLSWLSRNKSEPSNL